MSFYKICPVCGKKNTNSEILCCYCFADISSVTAGGIDIVTGSSEEDSENENDLNEQNINNLLTLITTEGDKIKILNGDVVGREGIGNEIFRYNLKISRHHSKFIFLDEKWFIEDLNSRNGTFINGNKIPPGKRIELTSNDAISFSHTFQLFIE